jgi:hypothetical protein
MIAGPVGSGKPLYSKHFWESWIATVEISPLFPIVAHIVLNCYGFSNCSIQQNICGPAGKTGAIDEA